MKNIYFLYLFVGVSIGVICFLIFVLMTTSEESWRQFKEMSFWEKVQTILGAILPF